MINCEFEYVSNHKDIELKILQEFANIHIQNDYIIFMNTNLYNLKNYLLINTYMCKFDLNILNNYYHLLSKQYIKKWCYFKSNSILLQYFNVFTNELRPLYCECCNNNDSQYDNKSNYCILMNLGDNILHKSKENIYLYI